MNIGNWTLENETIVGRPEGLPLRYIPVETIWAKCTRHHTEGYLWDTVIHIAERNWATFEDCCDLLKLMRASDILLEKSPVLNSENIDARTVHALGYIFLEGNRTNEVDEIFL